MVCMHATIICAIYLFVKMCDEKSQIEELAMELKIATDIKNTAGEWFVVITWLFVLCA